MNITSECFSFNVWEWFLHSSVLERTESDLSKINWFCGVILLILVVLVPRGRFPLCHTPIRPISAFQDQISILIVRCVTTWPRDHEVRINVASCFMNFLVLHRSLMGCNIFSNNGNDSLMFQKTFLTRIPYLSYLH